MFDIQLLNAINNWQRGGSQKQKVKRGEALKAASCTLPNTYKSIASTCYRQIALDKKAVWLAGTELHLKETISSWTESIDVAKEFKGGVPPRGYQGAIFKIQPGSASVIINLATLFKDVQFIEAIEQNKHNIIDFDKGIGRYGSSQQEVVIEVDVLPIDSIYAWGGYTSSEDKLAELFYERAPSPDELIVFKDLMVIAGQKSGPRWLSTPDAVTRVVNKLTFHGRRLSGL